MLGRLAERGNRLTTWARRNRMIEPGTRPVRVNLGSGLTVAPGWINIDASPALLIGSQPRVLRAMTSGVLPSRVRRELDDYQEAAATSRFIHHDLKYGIPLDDQAVDFVYSSHFLEHLDRASGLRLLREGFRVLRPDGVMRICVPDLEHAVRVYGSGDKQRFLRYFFSDDGDRHRHRYMYDFAGLSEALRSAGFTAINRRDYRHGAVPDLGLLDNRPDETLFVEAVRPADESGSLKNGD